MSVLSIEKYKKDPLLHVSKFTKDELVEYITLANTSYYNGMESGLTDIEYDILKDELIKKDPTNLILNEIGHIPIQGKVKLPIHLGSMDKIKPGTRELANYFKKYKGPYVISQKLDGISLLIVYKNKKISIYTRGNGTIGQNVSHLIPYINSIPKYEKDIIVRGELIFSKNDWLSINKKNKEFSNARNTMSGLLNVKKKEAIISKKELYKKSRFVAYELINDKFKSSVQLKKLKKLNFEVVEYSVMDKLTEDNLKNILISSKKTSLYEIDGLIVTNNKSVKRIKKGNPKHSIAFKMVLDNTTRITTVRDIVWQPSQWGKLIPVVHFDPVYIDGIKIKQALGIHAKFITENKIGKGAEIVIIRSGDVIPKIIDVVKEGYENGLPTNINYTWDTNGIHIIINEITDTIKIKKIIRFLNKLGVEHAKKGVVTNLFNNGFNTIPKLLNANIEDISNCDGMGYTSAEKIITSLQLKLNNCTMVELMAASSTFGSNFSTTRLNYIVPKFPDILNNIPTLNQVTAIEGIGPITAKLFLEGLPKFKEFLKTIPNKNFNKNMKQEKKLTKNIVFSGIRDKKLEQQLLKKDIKVSGKVNNNTLFVIVKTIDSNTTKVKDAKKNNIRIIDYDNFDINLV